LLMEENSEEDEEQEQKEEEVTSNVINDASPDKAETARFEVSSLPRR